MTSAGLEFGSKVLSGGYFPVSVTVDDNLVYVVNQLGFPNITGYTVSDTGQCGFEIRVHGATWLAVRSHCQRR